ERGGKPLVEALPPRRIIGEQDFPMLGHSCIRWRHQSLRKPISMTPAPEQFDEKPLDPAVERVRRKMMRLMLVSIGIMMVGLMAVVGAIVYKLGSSETQLAVAGEAPPVGFQSLLRLVAGSPHVWRSDSVVDLTL